MCLSLAVRDCDESSTVGHVDWLHAIALTVLRHHLRLFSWSALCSVSFVVVVAPEALRLLCVQMWLITIDIKDVSAGYKKLSRIGYVCVCVITYWMAT